MENRFRENDIGLINPGLVLRNHINLRIKCKKASICSFSQYHLGPFCFVLSKCFRQAYNTIDKNSNNWGENLLRLLLSYEWLNFDGLCIQTSQCFLYCTTIYIWVYWTVTAMFFLLRKNGDIQGLLDIS